MAGAVVHRLEAVEVDHHQRVLAPVTPAIGHRLTQALQKVPAVGQIGQVVVVGAVLQTLFEAPALVGDTQLRGNGVEQCQQLRLRHQRRLAEPGHHQYADMPAPAGQRQRQVGAQAAGHELGQGIGVGRVVRHEHRLPAGQCLTGDTAVAVEAVAQKALPVGIRHTQEKLVFELIGGIEQNQRRGIGADQLGRGTGRLAEKRLEIRLQRQRFDHLAQGTDGGEGVGGATGHAHVLVGIGAGRVQAGRW